MQAVCNLVLQCRALLLGQECADLNLAGAALEGEIMRHRTRADLIYDADPMGVGLPVLRRAFGIVTGEGDAVVPEA